MTMIEDMIEELPPPIIEVESNLSFNLFTEINYHVAGEEII